jgi:hypothetical protein
MRELSYKNGSGLPVVGILAVLAEEMLLPQRQGEFTD